MQLKVLKEFTDKHDLSVRYKPGDVLVSDDVERIDNLIERGLCSVVSVKSDAPIEEEKSQTETKPKTVMVDGSEYPLAKVKVALEALGVDVAKNAGVAAVVKEVDALTEQQQAQLSTLLNTEKE